jgi:hypothetical protein
MGSHLWSSVVKADFRISHLSNLRIRFFGTTDDNQVVCGLALALCWRLGALVTPFPDWPHTHTEAHGP